MFDKETLLALQEHKAIDAAKTALAFAHHDGNDLAALPSDFKLHNLEQYMPNRRRARGTMTTADVESFVDYTSAHAEQGASVFIDADAMSAIAVLNLGEPMAPGHADNKAKLALKRTAAFGALLFIANGGSQKQATVAEFLEDWPDQIKCSNDAGDITPAQAIAAIRKLTIETMRKLESEEQALSQSRSAFESVQAKSKDPIPTTMLFKCQPYGDLTERTFSLRLAVQTSGEKPAITLRIVKIEQYIEEMAHELADMITAKFADGNGLPVLVGAYSKAE